MARAPAVRQLVMFQIKLALDGLKDMVLLPASLVLGIFSIVTNRKNPESGLHATMRLGRKFDDYVGLYSAIEKQPASQLDDQFSRTEDRVRGGKEPQRTRQEEESSASDG